MLIIFYIMKNFSSNLKYLRKEKSLKQKEIAKIINVKPDTYSKWEQNKASASYEDLVKIADFHQVSIDYLLGHSDDLGNITVNLSPALALTRDENTLLTKFKMLNDSEKQLILKQLDAWIDKN